MNKKIILALLLIAFLIMPVIGLAGGVPTGADAANPQVAGCAAIDTKDLCVEGYLHVASGVRYSCFWGHDHPHPCRYRPPEAPEISPFAIIERGIDLMTTVLIAAAVIFVIMGAFTILTAEGDAEKMGAGRTKITYAIVAVIVAVAAQGLIGFIEGAFT
jgi:hypothetical protein